MRKELRPYQEQSIGGLRSGFMDKHRCQVLSAATGAGKSVIALEMLHLAVEKGSRVMFVCDRRVLVDQFSRHLDEADLPHGVLMADHWRYRPDAPVQVASIQTLERMEYWPKVDLVVIDEIHAVMRKSVMKFLENAKDVRFIGLTATPFHPQLGKFFSNIVSVVTMRQLVDEGYLVPFKVFAAKEIDTSGVPVVAGEWKKDDLESRGLQVVGDIVSDYVRLSQEVFGGPRKTICFSAGVAHGAALVQQFAEAGLNFVQVSYLDKDEAFREEVFSEFRKPDSAINGIISSDLLTRGFDQTDIEHVILARPLRKSFSQHVQMVGRGARSHPGKSFCVIQDHATNWLRFQEDWEDLFQNGATTLASDADTKKRKEPSQIEKERAKCPKCGRIWPSGCDTCPSCGFVRVKRSEVQTVPGELQELSGFQLTIERPQKQDWYSQLLTIAANRGYSDGWVANKYREKFGVWPRSLVRSPAPISLEVANWVKSRQIAWARAARRAA